MAGIRGRRAPGHARPAGDRGGSPRGPAVARRADEAAGRDAPGPPYGPTRAGRENGTSGSHLAAAAARAGASPPPGDVNPWRRAAGVLYAGKVYE